MNIIALVGRLTEAPELKQTPNGRSVVSATIAVDRPFAKDVVDFIPLVIWNQPAEYLCRYASKGTKIAVTGKLTTRKYEDKSGNKRTAFEVIGDAVEICTSAPENAAAPKSEPSAYTPSAYGGTTTPQFEEIPNDEGLPF